MKHMDEKQAAVYRDAYKKGLADGMRQLSRVLVASISHISQNNIDEIIKNMLEEQKRVIAQRAQKEQVEKEEEAKKQAAFSKELADQPAVQSASTADQCNVEPDPA
jgi:hypothetical protein